MTGRLAGLLLSLAGLGASAAAHSAQWFEQCRGDSANVTVTRWPHAVAVVVRAAHDTSGQGLPLRPHDSPSLGPHFTISLSNEHADRVAGLPLNAVPCRELTGDR